jgi:hypothetical protein
MDVHAAFKQMTMQVVGTTAFGCEGLSLATRWLRWAKPQEGEAGMPAESTSPWCPWARRMLSWRRSRTSRPPPQRGLTCPGSKLNRKRWYMRTSAMVASSIENLPPGQPRTPPPKGTQPCSGRAAASGVPSMKRSGR